MQCDVVTLQILNAKMTQSPNSFVIGHHETTYQAKASLESLYSRKYTKACNEWRDPSPRLNAWTTQLRRNIAAVASRWRHCVRFDRAGNRTSDHSHQERCLSPLRYPAGNNILTLSHFGWKIATACYNHCTYSNKRL